MLRKFLLLALLVCPFALHAQSPADVAAEEGVFQGYDGELRYVSRLLLSLAEAIPADKYSWRPQPGVRSVSEVLMHVAVSNFQQLSYTGLLMPPELQVADVEKTTVSKPEVIAYLRRSLDAVKTAHAQLKPADLQRTIKSHSGTVTVDGVYLRILSHDNEHMGQLIAYARINSIVPPWSAGVVLPK